MRSPVYPGSIANRFAAGDRTLQPKIDKLVLHSTEGGGLPSYDGGRTAPALTVDPWTRRTWQHFDSVARSTKTLRDTGGLAENRADVSQIEIVGYSDPTLGRKAGKYLPDLGEEGLAYIAGVVRWYHDEWDVPLVTPASWPAYPSSYGRTSARMTEAQYRSYRGVLGHLHVPDNVHGDPTLNIRRLMELARNQEGDDAMPITEAEFARIDQIVQSRAGYYGPNAPMIPNLHSGGSEWPGTTLGAMERRLVQESLLPAILQAVAGMKDGQDPEAVGAAVEAAIARGTAAANAAILAMVAEVRRTLDGAGEQIADDTRERLADLTARISAALGGE